MDTYHWDVLVTYHWEVTECFIWDLFETMWRRTDGTTLLLPLETSQLSNKTSWKRTTEMSWRRSIETSSGVSFEKYLRRLNVTTTSCCRVENCVWERNLDFSHFLTRRWINLFWVCTLCTHCKRISNICLWTSDGNTVAGNMRKNFHCYILDQQPFPV